MGLACWHCGKAYATPLVECPHCCAANPAHDLASAEMEQADNGYICHDWHVQDESFDHEFGTEVIVYNLCSKCGATCEYAHDEPDYYEE